MVKKSLGYRAYRTAFDRIFHLPQVIIWLIACLTVFVVAISDYFTGSLVTLSAFYLVPLILVTWGRSRTHAQMMILLIVISWDAAHYYSSPEHYTLGIVAWNSIVRWLHLTLTAEFLMLISKSQRELKAIAGIDSLTGIANRRAFNTELHDVLNNIKLNDVYIVMALLDVDFFKQINDKYGHPYGDFKLKQVASVLVITCSERDLCARLGGDEFVVVFTGSSPNLLKIKLEKLSERLKTEATSCSIGAFMTYVVSATPEVLYEQADRSLYETKLKGRGFVTVTSNFQNFSDTE